MAPADSNLLIRSSGLLDGLIATFEMLWALAIPAGVDLKLVLAALQQWGDVYVPREDGPTVLRRNTRSKALVDVGFVGKDGDAVPDEDVVFEPVAGGPADRSTWR